MTAKDDRELMLDRLLDAPRGNIWRCWTEPELITRWFAPAPWTTPRAEVDLRPGGASRVVMASPEGEEFPSNGIAYVGGWRPSEKPFFTAVIELSDEGGKTRYVATARHWTMEDKEAHEKMGFQEGWNLCADQLEKLAKSL